MSPRRYDEEFKRNCVDLLVTGGRTLKPLARELGVSAATLLRWADDGELARKQAPSGYRYHREAVRARARQYWATVRFHRAVPPSWLAAEGWVREPIAA